MDPERLRGGWSLAGMEFSVVSSASGLAIRFPEAPEGFESAFEPVDDATWVIRGGQFDGTEVTFSERNGEPVGAVGGVPVLSRLDRPATAPAGSGQTAPPLVVDEDTELRYRRVLDGLSDDGRNIDAELPTAPLPFVQWLMQRDEFIFHGSNLSDIDEFRPVRASMELNDTGGRGNLGAVYGTHDGLWSMFFAIVDRSRLRGSIRNGVGRYGSADRSIDLYQFSVHHASLAEEPFTTGSLYLLPRDTFERVRFYPGGPLSNEWASHEPVRPIARLTVRRDDFPFEIGGHDDGDLIRFGEMGDEIYGRLVSAARTESGFEIVTTADPALITEFIEMSSRFYPDVTREATETDGGVRITMDGPPAFVHSMEKKLAPHLE